MANMVKVVAIEPLFVDLENAAMALGIGVSTVQQLTRDHAKTNFPRPRKISGRRVGYPLAELRAWAADRPVSDLPPPPNTGAKKPKCSG